MKLSRLLPLLAFAFLSLLAYAQSVTPQNTVIEADGEGEMVSTDTETTIIFRDNVRVTGTNLKLTCDYLEVVVFRTGEKSATLGKLDKFKSLLAKGNVRMIQGSREAACAQAVVLPGEDKVVLTGNPVVVDHDQNSRIAGEKITMLRAQRQVIVEKPVLTGPELKDLGVDPSPKPATPAAVAPKQP